jgi:thiol-disulfide isomerase/thioredoxin
MKMRILIAILAVVLPYRFAFAAQTNDPSTELQTLIEKVNNDLSTGKTTEDALSNDIEQYDVLLAEHKGEKTDDVAKILLAKAMLYAQVFQDADKADALMKQLTNDFSGTTLVTTIQKQQAQQDANQKIQADLVVGKPFPDFNEKDVMGRPLSTANYKGKVVLVDFWATWCMPCLMEMPNVITTYQKYHDKGFEIIGVSLDQDQQKLLDYIKENNMPWPQYFDGQGWGNNLAQKYGIQVVPSNFLLDGNGTIIGKNLRGQDLADAVAKALNK